MNLLFWRKNRIIDAFAHQMADDLYSAISPEIMQTYLKAEEPDKKSDLKKHEQLRQKVIRELNNSIMRLQQFRVLHKLGVYGKARFHLTFTERLKELGYSPEAANEINRLLLLQTP